MGKVAEYLYRKAAKNKIPLGGSFELSPVCNFSCKMCYVRKTEAQIRKEGKTIKNWKEWLELAKQCREQGVLYLLLTGGEPFLYPNFRELYEQLHDMGFVLSINTNGTMIDEETIEWLKKKAPSRINITLYGASEETYKSICGSAKGYEKAVWAIRALKDAGIPIVINASMIPENSQDMETIIAFGKELGVNVRMSTYMFPPIRRECEKEDSRFAAAEAAVMCLRKLKCQFGFHSYCEDAERKLKTLEKSVVTEEDWGFADTEEYMRCRAGRSTFWVSWTGAMSACGLTEFPILVYPFENGFKNCWEVLTEKVRTTMVLKACSGCEKKEICNPCVAMIHAETGDANKKSSYLCEMTDYMIQRMQEDLERRTL